MATIPMAIQGVPIDPTTTGFWRGALTRLLRNRPALVGLVFITAFLFVAILAPLIAPANPEVGHLADGLQTPSRIHLMGTDLVGRDELSRVIWGARLSLQVAIVSVLIALVVGGLVGAIAGAAAGLVDATLMRVVDVLLAIPGLLLAIGIVAWLGQGLLQIMLAIALTLSPAFARLLRGSLLALRNADFVTAARTVGVKPVRILVRHMLPNALTPLIVQATLALGTAVIDVAGLGFLGLGPPDPRIAEWGTMLNDATTYLRAAPYLVFFPAGAIVIASVGFNLLGDGLREALDPRLRR
jgi:peptide/nickel transport system permease protein